MSLLASIEARFGTLELDVDLSVPTGETVVILGPNGAGKTSLLRCLAGLVKLARGVVELDGETLEDTRAGINVPPERRPIGFVFQDYLLFPHMSVLDNVAFGLGARGESKSRARESAKEWLERLALRQYGPARPHELSGGQAQRVALARALIGGPRLLLLDEPLSALDARARVEVRRDLRKHLASFEGTRLVVTHDPLEAGLLADRLVVLEGGRVAQTGTIDELRARPRSFYVADLVGLNLFRGRAHGDRIELESGRALVVPEAGRGCVFATVHPRAVALYRSRPDGSPRNVWRARVEGVDHEGDRARVRLGGPVPIVAEVTAFALNDIGAAEGEELWVSVKASEVVVYPA